MLNPGATASLSREEAIRLISEVAELQARLERLRVVWANWSKSRRSEARTSESPQQNLAGCLRRAPQLATTRTGDSLGTVAGGGDRVASKTSGRRDVEEADPRR